VDGVYVSTPAFNAEYADPQKKTQPPAYRNRRPELKAKVVKKRRSGTVCEERGVNGDEGCRRTNAAAVGGTRDQVIPAWRAEIEERRKQKKTGSSPASSVAGAIPGRTGLLARILREFLEKTTDIDFAAKHVEQGNITLMAFDSDAYNAKPWQWKLSYFWGPEAIAAARTAAAAW
jgi:hypothetical protein